MTSLSLTQIESVSLKRVYPTPSTEAIEAKTLWQDGPVLLMLVRRTELAASVTAHQDFITNKLGIRIAGVIKEVIEDDVAGFHSYLKNDMYLNEDLSFYSALHGGSIKKVGLLKTLFSPKIWAAAKRSKAKGIVNGSLKGEGTITGGFVLVSKDGVHFVHREVIGEVPDVNDILKACWQVVPEEKRQGVELPQVDAAASAVGPSCDADACALPPPKK